MVNLVRPGQGWGRQAGGQGRAATGDASWLTLGDAFLSSETGRGQMVLVVARWALILVGFALVLHAPNDLVDLQISVVGLLAMAVLNFALHISLVMNRAATLTVLSLASAGDILLITAMVATNGGFESYAFVFYYPAIAAFSLVFPFRIAGYFTAAMVPLYALTALTVSSQLFDTEPRDSFPILCVRLLTFGAVMAVSNMYRLVEDQREKEESPVAGTESWSSEPGRSTVS